MEPGAVGPYELLDVLARGGMGVVYRAKHCGTGRVVALKRVERVSTGNLESIRREIRTLSRLQHPGIVRILDQGVADGLPWYAMELLDGASLRTLFRAWHRGPAWGPAATEPETAARPEAARRTEIRPDLLPAILPIVTRLCETLAYMHGEGVVHRDLKPDNVLVGRDGHPVLVDFGLTATFADSRHGIEGGLAAPGTAGYMAPEQAAGERVDARADLYALGCVLFEALAGHPPRRGTDLADLPALPAHVADALRGLLAPRRAERIGHADAARAALAPAEAAGPLPSRGRPYLYEPRLCGRDAELRDLEGSLHAIAAGAGTMIVISGESGVGKTRLATELARVASRQGYLVLAGQCLRGAPPLHPFRGPLQTVADHCRTLGGDAPRRLLGRGASVVAEVEPSIAALPGLAPLAAPPELPHEASRLRLFEALAHVLGTLAAEAPVLLLVDDLQWADDLTAGFLEHLVDRDRLRRMRVLVLGTSRTEEPFRHPAPARRVELRRLDDRDVGALVADMMALPSPPAELTALVALHSEGNPFLAGEYLRAAVAASLLERDGRGRWQLTSGDLAANFDVLPHGVRELAAAGLRSLSGPGCVAVTCAAVLGRQASRSLIERLSDLGAAACQDAVDEAVSRHVLEESAAAPPVRFAHDRIRQAVYDGLPAAERLGLHARAALLLEALPDEAPERTPAAIGAHWYEAGEPERAAPWLLAAARHATRHHALEDAGRLYDAFVSCAAPGSPLRPQARLELASDVRRLRGELPEARSLLETALEEAAALGDAALAGRIQHALGLVLYQVGDGTARPRFEEARAAAAAAGDAELEVQALLGIARDERDQGRNGPSRDALGTAIARARSAGLRAFEAIATDHLAIQEHVEGRLAQAEARYREALAIHRELGKRRQEGTVLGNLAVLLDDQGRAGEARRLYEEALDVHTEVGDLRLQAAVVGSLANLDRQEGRLAQARSLYDEALEIVRRTGDVRLEGQLLGSRATLAHDLGDVEEARRIQERALAMHRRTDNRRFEAIALANLGSLEQESGRPDAAEALYAEARDVATRVGDRGTRAMALANLANLRRDRGRHDEARALYEEAIAIHADVGDRRYQGIALVGHAMLERLTGRLEAASARLDAAERLLGDARDRAWLAACACERGQLALAAGSDAALHLARARELGGARPSQELAGALRSLENAMAVRRHVGNG